MFGAVEEGDSGDVAVVGGGETHDVLLGAGRCEDVFEGGINGLGAAERVSDLHCFANDNVIMMERMR